MNQNKLREARVTLAEVHATSTQALVALDEIERCQLAGNHVRASDIEASLRLNLRSLAGALIDIAGSSS